MSFCLNEETKIPESWHHGDIYWNSLTEKLIFVCTDCLKQTANSGKIIHFTDLAAFVEHKREHINEINVNCTVGENLNHNLNNTISIQNNQLTPPREIQDLNNTIPISNSYNGKEKESQMYFSPFDRSSFINIVPSKCMINRKQSTMSYETIESDIIEISDDDDGDENMNENNLPCTQVGYVASLPTADKMQQDLLPNLPDNLEQPPITDIANKEVTIKTALPTTKSLTMKLYACDLCGAAFFHDSQLKYHKRTHSKRRSRVKDKESFQCDLCPKSFNSPGYLRKHIYDMHLTVSPNDELAQQLSLMHGETILPTDANSKNRLSQDSVNDCLPEELIDCAREKPIHQTTENNEESYLSFYSPPMS